MYVQGRHALLQRGLPPRADAARRHPRQACCHVRRPAAPVVAKDVGRLAGSKSPGGRCQ
ncbi:hypothetical protein ACP4OV_026231 [Aristida adscensionis]